MSDDPAIVYKVLTAGQWSAFRDAGSFAGAPIDIADGYIHLSTAAQVTRTVDKHFAGQQGLWIVAVDLAMLGDAVRWEVSRGGALFPHVYATLPMDAVIAAAPLERDENGAVRLPDAG